MTYKADKEKALQTVFIYTLLILVVIAGISAAWTYQQTAELKNKLRSAHKAILTSGRYLEKERTAREMLEKQLHELKNTLETAKPDYVKPEELATGKDHKTTENNYNPLPEEQIERPEQSEQSVIYQNLNFDHPLIPSITFFRGKCTSC